MTSDLNQLLVLRDQASAVLAIASEYEKIMTPWQRATLKVLCLGAEYHQDQVASIDARIAELSGQGPRAA